MSAVLAPRAWSWRAYSAVWISLGAVLFAVLCGAALVMAIGVPLGDALAAFADGAWGSPYAIASSINRALALGLIGLGFIFANRANLTNVGGEGQIAMGGMAATAMALYGGASHLPAPLSYLVPMLAAALAGGLWGGVAGVLKAKVGTNEVISTLLLSFVAVWLLYWSVQSVALLRVICRKRQFRSGLRQSARATGRAPKRQCQN